MRATGTAHAGLGYVLVAALVVVGLLLPLFVVEIPPVLDYPNHLARLWLLSMSPPDPILSSMYAPDWHLLPNLAIDATAHPLAPARRCIACRDA